MGISHDVELKDLIVELQDGTRLTLQRDEHDRLVTTDFAPAEGTRYQAGEVPAGWYAIGFGPWPTWQQNLRNGVATQPDEESGLFEPERLFVLREQYAFVAADPAEAKPFSLGPIHKVWWAGTEHIVQARRGALRH